MKRLIIVGGGVAGASSAYFAAQRGWQVTVVDCGQHAASDVPSALLNPVRGQSGQVPARAAEGLALTWELIATLTAAGYDVPHGRSGVIRPVPDERTQTKFNRNLAELPHEWWDSAAVPELRSGWHAALYLPQGGWVDGPALCRSLLAASGAGVVRGRVEATDGQGGAVLKGGEALEADAVVWCGGSFGTQTQRPAHLGARPLQSHRAGTLLTLQDSPGPLPLSFGGYLAPAAQGGVLGATFERPAAEWSVPQLPLTSLDWLLGKGRALRSLRDLQVRGRWSGTRLSGLRLGQAGPAEWELSGLGSKGFLLGPLLAHELVAQLG